MDVLLRGFIERQLDSLLSEVVLASALKMFKEGLSPTVRNFDDSLFGYVVGRLIQFSFSAVQTYYSRDPSVEEFNEIGKILERRATEIKSKITLVVNR